MQLCTAEKVVSTAQNLIKPTETPAAEEPKKVFSENVSTEQVLPENCTGFCSRLMHLKNQISRRLSATSAKREEGQENRHIGRCG